MMCIPAVAACVTVTGTVSAVYIERGRSVYASRCAFCHGTGGKGDGPAGAALKPPPTNFASAEYWKMADAEGIKAAIADGKPGTAMVPFKAVLSPEEIDDVVVYLKTLRPAH